MKSMIMQKQSFYLSALALSVLSSMAHAAPQQPDAGQTSRELQQQPNLTQPAVVAPLAAPAEAAPAPAASNEGKVLVKAIRVTGSTRFSAAELEALVSSLPGAERTLSELNAGAAKITDFYRQRGYVVARAYLPAQDVKDGVITIQVLEGVIGQLQLNNQSRVADQYVNGYLSNVQSGMALQGNAADRAVLLLGELAGVSAARASLQPGASVGATDLLVTVDPAKSFAANLELDNYGNRYTGENRAGAALAFNSPLKRGDQLTVRALGSNGGMTYARLAYQLPVGGNGMKVGAAYSSTRYVLGQDFASLQASGTAGNASMFASYPIVRTLTSKLTTTVTYESKRLHDQTDSTNTSVDKQVQVLSLGLAGSRQDVMLGGGVSAFDVSVVSGKLGLDATTSATDATTAQSEGNFAKLGYNLSRLQRVTDKDVLWFNLSGQQANKNLGSSERFSLGGANGVRAYPQGEGSGDDGWMLNVEMRHRLIQRLEGVAFYDAGSVTVNHSPYTTADNTRAISGFGVGVNAQYQMLQLKTFVAWRANGGDPLAEPAATSKTPRVWVQLSAAF